MDLTDPLEGMAPSSKATLISLANTVAQAMLDAVREETLSSRGVLFAASIGVKAFSQAAQQVQHWTAEQRDDYLRAAIASAQEIDVQAMLIGAPRQ